MRGQMLLISPRQLDLPHGGGGLALLQGQFRGVKPENRSTQSNRTGGDDHNIHAFGAKARNIFGQRGQPVLPQSAAAAVNQKRRANLDHDTVRRS